MKERPILFSAPMVLALLAGAKTQTRRIVKPQPREHHWFGLPGYRHTMHPNPVVGGLAARSIHSHQIPGRERVFDLQEWISCPYGAPGDRLWVKETWRSAKSLDKLSPSGIGKAALDANCQKPWAPIEYVADGRRDNWEESFGKEPGKTRVSIHMPRWASRLTLEITHVRVERLTSLSCGDSIAEGIEQVEPCPEQFEAWRNYAGGHGPRSPISSYASLWESINGEDSWALNPWVWVVTFKRVLP